MKNLNLVGTTWIGNSSLLDEELVGVFASDRSDILMPRRRDHWAADAGLEGCKVVGSFRNLSERNILEILLRYGGHAVWIVDRKLPTIYSSTCCQAFAEGRLLVVSCFWNDESLFSTRQYCADFVQRLASRLILWAPSSGGLMQRVASCAYCNGKLVEVH